MPISSGECDQYWITDAWEKSLKILGKAYKTCDEVCRREVWQIAQPRLSNTYEDQLCSRHWPNRSQLIYGCKQDIKYFFQINQKDPTKVKRPVKWLLQIGRFNCSDQEVKVT